ncbi:hypothetical protein K438DRAFT_1789714 [Mycena galopus ATCC 62051]|nr:hypothetical protein K438DRAFT_1789714 [Mycena galopus ATCC 62051]
MCTIDDANPSHGTRRDQQSHVARPGTDELETREELPIATEEVEFMEIYRPNMRLQKQEVHDRVIDLGPVNEFVQPPPKRPHEPANVNAAFQLQSLEVLIRCKCQKKRWSLVAANPDAAIKGRLSNGGQFAAGKEERRLSKGIGIQALYYSFGPQISQSTIVAFSSLGLIQPSGAMTASSPPLSRRRVISTLRWYWQTIVEITADCPSHIPMEARSRHGPGPHAIGKDLVPGNEIGCDESHGTLIGPNQGLGLIADSGKSTCGIFLHSVCLIPTAFETPNPLTQHTRVLADNIIRYYAHEQHFPRVVEITIRDYARDAGVVADCLSLVPTEARLRYRPGPHDISHLLSGRSVSPDPRYTNLPCLLNEADIKAT